MGRKTVKDQEIVVIGAGIAGLNAAMALAGRGRKITLIERDPPPPDASPDEAFNVWERKGVGHLRHSHAFLARLYMLIKTKHPDLLKDLLAAGCRELRFEDTLPATLRADYVPQPEDENLTILTSRRTTLEFVMRAYVGRMEGVTIQTHTRVTGLVHDNAPDGTLRITGLTYLRGEDAGTLTADLLVDAGGKNAFGTDWLRDAGVTLRTEVENAGILYYTRHYRLNPGQSEPERGKLPGGADIGYVKYGIFPADNGCFSITLAVPEIEMELRRAIIRPENFDAICRAIPALTPWIEETRVTPTSRVFGMGELKSQWRHFMENGRPVVLNYFPIGDCLIRTNPLYGRGCSFAAVAAEALNTALSGTTDPAEQARIYFDEVTREIRPYYDVMRKQDAASSRQAANTLVPDYKPGLRAKLTKSFVEDAMNIALRADITLFRQAMQGFHMLDHPNDWLKRPRNILRVLGFWARGKRRNADYYLPRLGPKRHDMFSRLKISPTADMRTPQANT
ncbi:MAG: FAD-dependent oxidoreductase [Rhodobiaceae bacterium]|nr:FAD-dependent oxidoreductase [Rhodobiaceae bacterium]